jgi:hypothetical protein
MRSRQIDDPKQYKPSKMNTSQELQSNRAQRWFVGARGLSGIVRKRDAPQAF